MMNYFEILNLPVNYDLSVEGLEELTTRFENLAARYHPDKVASLSSFEKKQYMQLFTTLNDAYHTLKSPITRAEYILKINNINYDPEQMLNSDPELLEIQMQFREDIDDSQTLRELSTIKENIQANITATYSEIARFIEEQLWEDVVQTVGKAKFFDKLRLAAQQKQASLEKE